MARLFTCGFEAQSATEWSNTDGTAPSFSTTIHNSGSVSGRFNPTTAARRSIAYHGTYSATAHVFLRAYIYIASAPNVRTAIMAWSEEYNTATGFYCIKLNPDRTLIAGASGVTSGTASAAIPLNTWTRVEMEYSDSAGTLKGYVNGVQWVSLTGMGLGGGEYARFGVIQAATADIYFDDIAVNDPTGATDNGLPGEVTGDEPDEPGTPFSDVADDFNDNTVDDLWTDNYGGATETGGRARVPCTTTYAAYATDTIYTLAGSHIGCRMYPAAANGATGECFTQLLVLTPTAGTDAAIYYDAITDTLKCALRVGYSDAAGVTSLTYDPVAHAWVRIAEASGSLLFQTSPDGSSWTTRRTATSPGWVSGGDLAVQLICHRAEGSDNYAEFDNVNTLPTGETIEGTAALVATSSLTAAGQRTAGTAAALTASSTLTVTAERTATADAALTASSLLAAAGTRLTHAEAELAATSTLDATGNRKAVAAAALTAGTELDAAGERAATGTATLTAAGDLTADGHRTAETTVALAADAALTATAQQTANASAALTAETSLTATAARTTHGTVDLSAAGSLDATSTATRSATAALTAASRLTVETAGTVSGTADLDASSTLTADGQRIARTTAALAADGTLTATGLRTVTTTATLTATSTLAAAGHRAARGGAVLTMTTALDAAGIRRARASATLTASSTLTVTAAGPGMVEGEAHLTAGSTLTATALRTRYAVVHLAATATLTVAFETGTGIGDLIIGPPHTRQPPGLPYTSSLAARPYSRPPAGLPHT